MIVGYAGFSQILRVTETSEVTNNWDISITDVKTKGGTATNKTEPSYESLTANFDVNFKSIGDYIEYDVTVTNNGNVDAYLNTIEITNENNETVNMTYSGIEVGDVLTPLESKTFTVKLLYQGGTVDGNANIAIGYGGNEEVETPVVPTGKKLVIYDYETNGGTGELEKKYYEEGESVDLNITGKKDGYTFVGWNIDKDAKKGLSELSISNDNVTLYAIYKKELKATYKLGTGIYKIGKENDSCFIYNNESSCTLTLPNIEVKEGYELDGWYEEKENKKATENEITLTENVTYIARAVDKTSPTITLTPNSNSNYLEKEEVIVTIRDLDSGLKANQQVYYAWSISNTEKPEYINYVETSNKEGEKEATVTISSGEGLTGTYYLWIKEGTISDVSDNLSKEEISGEFNFDNQLPILGVSTSKTSNSITLVAQAYAESGIEIYEYSIDDGESWEESKTNTYTFKKLKDKTEYSIKVRVTSKVGKQIASETIVVETEEISAATFSITPEGELYAQEKTLTVSSNCDTCVNEYSIDNGNTWKEFPSETFDMKFLSAESVMTRSSGGSNAVTSTYTVTNIDSTPSGMIKINSSETVPGGYLACNGQAVSRTTYKLLFEAIGTTYGSGDGSTTFNVPNLNGRVPVGKSSSTFTSLGKTGGSINTTLTVENIPLHNHTLTASGTVKSTFTGKSVTTSEKGSHTHTFTRPVWLYIEFESASSIFSPIDDQDGEQGTAVYSETSTNGAHTHTVTAKGSVSSTFTGTKASTSSVGSGTSFTNMQPYAVINYVIKY